MHRTAVFIVGGYAFALIGLGAGYVPDLASAQVAVTAKQASGPG